MLDDVEKQLQQRFELSEARTEQVHEALLDEVFTRVSLKCNRHGKPVFRYWFGDSRVSRGTFQTLTCAEARCPRRQALRQQWFVHTGLVKPTRATPSRPCGSGALAAEERIQWANQTFFAREALFSVNLKCSHEVHEPLRINIKGWDVFDPNGYQAGGWVESAPMFETLEQVRAWLHARHPVPNSNSLAV